MASNDKDSTHCKLMNQVIKLSQKNIKKKYTTINGHMTYGAVHLHFEYLEQEVTVGWLHLKKKKYEKNEIFFF